MSDYKALNLSREVLDANIQHFLELNGHQLDGQIQNLAGKKRVEFGSAGAEFAMVDLHLNSTGTTTIQWKLGRNQPLGETLAVFLKSTINPAEFETVSLALEGVRSDDFDPIIDCINDSGEFEIEINRDEPNCKQVTLKSIAYQDQLKLTLHKKTRNLQIQGKPLSCYRRVIFMLTGLLDLKGLAQVLYKKDDNAAEVVRKEMAEEHLKGIFPRTYELLPEQPKRLLLSSCCVKLASPQLPDYCLLLYPDLRALEGILKGLLSEHEMYVAEAEHGFGDFFDVDKKSGQCNMKAEYVSHVGNTAIVSAFNNGYTFYRKHRHALFHMDEFDGVSRLISSLDIAISLSKDAYSIIDGLYTARM